MIDCRRIPAVFVADSPGLDFLNSVTTSADGPVDGLCDGAGLLSWLEQARMVPRATLDALRLRSSPAELDHVAAQARDLRQWFADFVRRRKGQPLSAVSLDEIEPLNRVLRRDDRGLEILAGAAGGSVTFELRESRRWRSAESLLMPIAEAVAKVVCNEDFTQVKACEGHGCSLIFADHTRGHVRRWCRMATCGNRAKVAAHRQRAKEQAVA